MSSVSDFFRGSTVFIRIPTWESVGAGAFFRPDFQMPEKEVSRHTGQDVMIPPAGFSDLTVIRPRLCLCFLRTLFCCPSYTKSLSKKVFSCFVINNGSDSFLNFND